jgi:hypothetical protein
MNRIRSKASQFDLDKLDSPLVRKVRAAVLDIVHDAPDSKELRRRAENAKSSATRAGRRAQKRAMDSAHQARDTKVAEAVVAGVGAALPFITTALTKRSNQKAALLAARRVGPVVVRTHPVLVGFAAIGGAVAGTLALRAWMQRRDAAVVAETIIVAEDVSRWEDEGGDSSAAVMQPAQHLRRADTGGSSFPRNE